MATTSPDPQPPNPFLGVWQRESIRFDAGPLETDRQAIWIQAESLFADVRSPWITGPLTAHRYRSLDWRSRFEVDLTAFGGHFTWTSTDGVVGTCTWHHILALTPRSFPDSSRYRWIDQDQLLELGVYQDDTGQAHPFEERWQRVHPGPVQEHQSPPGQPLAIVLTAGAWAIAMGGEDQRQSPRLPWDTNLATFTAHTLEPGQPTWKPLMPTIPEDSDPAPPCSSRPNPLK